MARISHAIVHACAGELYTFKADNPQASNLLGVKETYGPSTKQICKECMLLQTDLRKPNLQASFMSSPPPIQLRTSQHHRTLMKELLAENSAAKRKKLAMQHGYDLDGASMPIPNAFTDFPYDLQNEVYDRLCYEGQHDFFLGPYEEIVGGSCLIGSCCV